MLSLNHSTPRPCHHVQAAGGIAHGGNREVIGSGISEPKPGCGDFIGISRGRWSEMAGAERDSHADDDEAGYTQAERVFLGANELVLPLKSKANQKPEDTLAKLPSASYMLTPVAMLKTVYG